MINLDKLEAKARAATPGPWQALENPEMAIRWVEAMCHAGGSVCTAHDNWSLGQNKRNSVFIAAANPETVLALIDRLRRAEKNEATARKALESVKRAVGTSTEAWHIAAHALAAMEGA